MMKRREMLNSKRPVFINLIVVIFIAVLLISCARLPMKVSNSTLLKYEKIYEEQKATSGHPLLGIWQVTFAIDEKTDTPKDAYYSSGEIVFVSIKRGENIDFVCSSYLGDFGGLSDQGPAHTVNFNGSTFWSFLSKSESGEKYTGKLTGILGSRGKAEAVLKGSQLRIYEYPEPTEEDKFETKEVMTTTKIVGGPLTGSLYKGTVATIFLERRQ